MEGVWKWVQDQIFLWYFPYWQFIGAIFKKRRSQPIYLFNTVDNMDAEGAIVTFPPIVSIPTIFGLFYP